MMNSCDTSLQDVSCGKKETAQTPPAADAVEQGPVGSWSFDALYEQYQQPIYRYLVSMVTSPMQAEDLTQEVFVRVLRARALPQLSSEFNVSAWLYRIARNLAIDVLRRRRLIAWSSLEADVVEKEGAAQLDPQTRYDGYSEEVLLAFERMPPVSRHVLVLYELEGASYEQIARQTHRAPGSVKMSLVRARKKFRQHYQDVRNEVRDDDTERAHTHHRAT